MADKRNTDTPTSTPADTPTDTPDERAIPLDIRDTRSQPGPDEEKMGFQNVEGPGVENDADRDDALDRPDSPDRR